MNTNETYEVVVVGGGPAGVTTALYTTRLGHSTAIFDGKGGRHAAVAHVHNLIGVSEEVSGRDLADHALDQLSHYGADVYIDTVEEVTRADERFRVRAAHATIDADCIVLATGFRDRGPHVSGLEAFAGVGLYYCIHCDAYNLGDAAVFVIGHDEGAAHKAMTMLNFTGDVDLLLNGREPTWDDATARQLRAHPIDRIDTPVVSPTTEDGRLTGLRFSDDTTREYDGGFATYGIEYTNELAVQLGCDLAVDGAIEVDERRETSVDGVYAVGDVTHGQNQTPIAIGDGAYAGIAIHKALRTYPRPVEELETEEEQKPPSAPPHLRARMRQLRERKTAPGLHAPAPQE